MKSDDLINMADPAAYMAPGFVPFVYVYPLFFVLIGLLVFACKGPAPIYGTCGMMATFLGLTTDLDLACIRWSIDGPWREASYIVTGVFTVALGGYLSYRCWRAFIAGLDT